MTGLPPLPPSVRVVEVGLRDGLQAVPAPILSTEQKVELVEGLVASGVREVEAVSFAHPRVLPQLADAEEVMRRVPRGDGTRYRGLVPNAHGARRASGTGLDEVVLVVSAEEEMSRRNQNRGVDAMLEELAAVAAVTADDGCDLLVAVACAFFAPAHGPVAWADTLRVVDAAAAAGATGVYLAATTGMEHPVEIAAGIAAVRDRHPALGIGVHLHSRNGLGLANAVAAMQVGVAWLEAAFGGLGGDLWFPGDPEVLGNTPTEDLVHTCEMLGVATGIDLSRYLAVVHRAAELTGRRPSSFVARGGSREELAHASWPDLP